MVADAAAVVAAQLSQRPVAAAVPAVAAVQLSCVGRVSPGS